MTKLTELFNKNLFVESVKQCKYVMILHTIALFIVTTMVAYMTRWEYNYTEFLTYSEYPNTVQSVIDSLTGNSAVVFFVIILAVLATVYVNFSYLFKPNSTQFYSCMPFTRSTMYISKASASFVSIITPVIIVLAVNMFIYYGNMGMETNMSIGELSLMGLNVIISYCVIFSAVLFGTSIACSSFSMIFSAAFVCLWHYATIIASELCLITWVEYYELTIENNLTLIFPPYVLLNLNDKEPGWQACFYIFAALYILVFIPLGLLCYKKRKSENTNKFIVFDRVASFYKCYISIIGALGLGSFFVYFELPDALCWLCYGIIFVLLYCVLQAIFEKNMQSLFKNMKKPLIIALCFMIIIAPLMCGLWQPGMVSPKSCNSVEVYSSDFEITFKEKESIEKTVDFLSTEGGGEAWLHYNIDLKVPFFKLIGQDWHYSGEAYENYLAYVLSSEEYFNDVEEKLLKGMNFEVNAVDLSWMCYDSENVEEFKNYITTLMEEMRKYDYKTKTDSGLWGYIDNKEGNLNIRIYNCYKDFINMLQKSEKVSFREEKNEPLLLEVTVDRYEGEYNLGSAVRIYYTDDKEIVKKFDDAMLNFWPEKTQNVYIRIYRSVPEEDLDITGVWAECTVNYYDLSKELRDIINPENISFWDLAEENGEDGVVINVEQ